eukprot:3529224-Amphidinium_carterae.1
MGSHMPFPDTLYLSSWSQPFDVSKSLDLARIAVTDLELVGLEPGVCYLELLLAVMALEQQL